MSELAYLARRIFEEGGRDALEKFMKSLSEEQRHQLLQEAMEGILSTIFDAIEYSTSIEKQPIKGFSDN